MHIQFASFASGWIKSQLCDDLTDSQGSNTAASSGHHVQNAGIQTAFKLYLQHIFINLYQMIMIFICPVNYALSSITICRLIVSKR